MGDFFLNFLHLRLRPRSWAAFAFGLSCVLAALVLRSAADFLTGPGLVPMAPFYPAVLFATLIGGLEAGALAAGLSILLGWWAFTPPLYSFRVDDMGDVVSLIVFALALALIVACAESYRRLVARLEVEEHQREMIVAELGHRVKNKLSTVYAILRLELHPYPEIWRKIQTRLQSLAAADEFVVRADGRDGSLGDLLLLTLAPYEASRITMTVADVPIPAKPSTILALVFHELATNAAKHGALSNDHGTVAISSTVSGGTISVDWVENGGPPVTPPAHRGFGSALLERALKPYQGRVEQRFERDGLICRMSFSLPESPRSRAIVGKPAKEHAKNTVCV